MPPRAKSSSAAYKPSASKPSRWDSKPARYPRGQGGKRLSVITAAEVFQLHAGLRKLISFHILRASVNPTRQKNPLHTCADALSAHVWSARGLSSSLSLQNTRRLKEDESCGRLQTSGQRREGGGAICIQGKCVCPAFSKRLDSASRKVAQEKGNGRTGGGSGAASAGPKDRLRFCSCKTRERFYR